MKRLVCQWGRLNFLLSFTGFSLWKFGSVRTHKIWKTTHQNVGTKLPFIAWRKTKRLVESVAELVSLLTWNKNHIFQQPTSSLFHNLRTLLKIGEGRLNLNLRNLIQILSQKFRDFTFENLLGCSWKILYHVAKIISPKIEKNRKIFCQTLLRILRVLYQELFPVRTLTCSQSISKRFFKSKHEIGILSLAY